jgi:hypothetical protein
MMVRASRAKLKGYLMPRQKGSKPKSSSKGEPAVVVNAERARVSGSFPNRTDIERFVTGANRYAEQSAEASGNLGQHTTQFVEKWGIEKSAVTFFRRLAKMDAAKRVSAWSHLQALMDVAGFDSTESLFGDERDAAKERMIGADSEEDEPPAPPPGVGVNAADVPQDFKIN